MPTTPVVPRGSRSSTARAESSGAAAAEPEEKRPTMESSELCEALKLLRKAQEAIGEVLEPPASETLWQYITDALEIVSGYYDK